MFVPYKEVYSLDIKSRILFKQLSELYLFEHEPVDQKRFLKMGFFVEKSIISWQGAEGIGFHCPPCANDIIVYGKALSKRLKIKTLKTRRHNQMIAAYKIMLNKLNQLRPIIRDRFEKISDSLKEGFCDPILEMVVGNRVYYTLNPRTGTLTFLRDIGSGDSRGYPFPEFYRSAISIPIPADAKRRGCTVNMCTYDSHFGNFRITDNDDPEITLKSNHKDFYLSGISLMSRVIMCSLGDGRVFIMYCNQAITGTKIIDSTTHLEVDKPLLEIESDIQKLNFRFDTTLSFRLIPFTESQKYDIKKKLTETMPLIPIVLVQICIAYLLPLDSKNK